MNRDELINRIRELAGPQRAESFAMAAGIILDHKMTRLIETGCYRGTPADGQSTLILALIAKQAGATFTSYEINRENIERAEEWMRGHGLFAFIHEGDSVSVLSRVDGEFDFAYLDSFDHDPANPGPCQRHQLAEVGAILGKMATPGAILLDDADFESGGKVLLSSAFLLERGWNMVYSGYQRLFTNTK